MTRQEAADRIASAFEAGIAPWSRSSRLYITCALPVDATGEPIQGVNTWLLELAAIERKYRNCHWATRRQWADLGGEVVRGEGTPVLGSTDGEHGGEDRVLYNVEQVAARRGAPVAALERFWVAPRTLPDYDLARRRLAATGAKVVSAERCFCVVCSDPTRDFIGMTPLDPLWGDTDRWWSAMFHELTHWVTSGFQRLHWRGEYAQGELIAELGAAILTTHCGVPMSRSVADDGEHVGAWIDGIRREVDYFEQACAVAELAASYVLDLAHLELRA